MEGERAKAEIEEEMKYGSHCLSECEKREGVKNNLFPSKKESFERRNGTKIFYIHIGSSVANAGSNRERVRGQIREHLFDPWFMWTLIPSQASVCVRLQSQGLFVRGSKGKKGRAEQCLLCILLPPHPSLELTLAMIACICIRLWFQKERLMVIDEEENEKEICFGLMRRRARTDTHCSIDWVVVEVRLRVQYFRIWSYHSIRLRVFCSVLCCDTETFSSFSLSFFSLSRVC